MRIHFISTADEDIRYWRQHDTKIAGRVIYAGTKNTEQLIGGLFKSTNGGNSWTSSNNGITNTNINSLAIDPINSQIIYAGTSGGGVFKSTNSGTSWTTANSGLNNKNVNSLSIDPTSGQTIYAGTSGGVFKTSNGGSSWNASNNGITDSNVQTVFIDPSNSLTLYAGTYSGGLFKSTNGGTACTTLYAPVCGTDGKT